MFVALVAGAAGLGISAIGFLKEEWRPDFFRSYLVAWCFCMGLSLGSLALLMLQHMVGGQWGLALRRLLETAASPLVLVAQAALFVPVLLGLDYLYPWVNPGEDPILKGRQIYMNVPFFVGRFLFFFGIWVILGTTLWLWSAKEDKTPDEKGVSQLGEWFRRVSAPGLLIYALTMTFAGIDWGMSVNPHWFSTMYGVLFSFGPLLSALTFLVAVLILLLPYSRLGALVQRETLADLGSLMLAFVMMWAYLSFSQYLLIWSANLKVEVPYFVYRTQTAYGWVGLALVLGHFVLPFLYLLIGDNKRSPRALLIVAVWLLVMRFLDYYWTISPTLTHGQLNPAMLWLDVAALVGVVGVIVGVFLWQLQRQPLVPEHDPRLSAREEGYARD
jgi:hypothetical protein